MGNLDLERALNPWMFDKDGNPTPEAEKQFPDLLGTPGVITAGGGAVTTAHQTWESRFLTLGGNLITIGQNLQDNANGYTSTENTNLGHMRAVED